MLEVVNWLLLESLPVCSLLYHAACQECAEQEQSDPEWKEVDNKSGEQPWP